MINLYVFQFTLMLVVDVLPNLEVKRYAGRHGNEGFIYRNG